MSSSVFVKFYLNGKQMVGNTVCIDKLKELLDGWSWCDELISVTNKENTDANEYWYEDFLGYRKAIPDSDISEIHLTRDSSETSVDDVSIEEMKSPDFKKNYVKVYGWKKEETNGEWYNSDSFYNAEQKFTEKLISLREELRNLLNMKDSIEYYKLNESQQERLDEDISWKKEIVEEYEYKEYICQYMVDLFDTMTDMFGESWKDSMLAYIYIM